MRSTQFDDRSPYEEELERDWQGATTLAGGRRKFTKLNSGLPPPPKLMPVQSEVLELLPVLRQAGKSSKLTGKRNTLKVPA